MQLKKLFFILALLGSMVLPAQAQFSGGAAYRIISGSSLPATCTAGPGVADVYVKTGGSPGIYYCSATNTWTLAAGGGGGTGDVVGPASATDNAVVRFDLTTGKLVQNSVVLIGDTGNITGVGTLNTHTIPGGTDTFALLNATQTLASKTLSSPLVSGTLIQTSNAAQAFCSGPNGCTNPVLSTVNNVASAATGVSITGNAAGAGADIQVTSSAAIDNLNIRTKGAGQISFFNNAIETFRLWTQSTSLFGTNIRYQNGVGGTVKAFWDLANVNFRLASDGYYGFSSSTDATGAADWRIVRAAAGVGRLGGSSTTDAGKLLVAPSTVTALGDITIGNATNPELSFSDTAETGGIRFNSTSNVLEWSNDRSTWNTFSGGGGSGANPTASVGLSAVNGVATTFMRSDAAPPLDQAIAPTWTGAHIWSLSNAAAVAIGPNGNTNPAFRVVTNVASATSGISITGRADGTAPTLQTLARPTQTASIAGNGLEVRADDAVAGSSTAGAAAGGVLTLQSGAAARLTSGNANGGNINIVPGAGIGTGTRGQVVISDNGAVLNDVMLRFSSGATNQGWTNYFGWAYMFSGASVAGFINGDIRLASTTPFGWTNSSVGSTIDAGFNRLGVAAVRVITSSSNPGNLLLGTSSGAFGTSAAGVLAFSGSTAPSTSTTDTVQVYSGDAAATDHNLYARNEAGQINRLTGLAVRNSAQFDVTSSTTLATITGLSENVEAGRTYAFRAYVQTSAGAGGVKFAVGGTATATAISYEGELTSASDDNVVLIDRATALGTAVCDSTTTTSGTCKIEGVIQVNAAGTLVIQFAQSASNGTASSVLANQYLQLIPIS